MKTISIILIISITTINAFAQTKEYKIYMFGNGAAANDSCAIAVNKKYGFQLINAGCRPTNAKIKHNKKILVLLNKQNPSNWKEKYKTEYSNCKGIFLHTFWFEDELYKL